MTENDDRVLRLWEVPSGKLLHKLNLPQLDPAEPTKLAVAVRTWLCAVPLIDAEPTSVAVPTSAAAPTWKIAPAPT